MNLRIVPWMLVAAAIGFAAAGLGRLDLSANPVGSAVSQIAPLVVTTTSAQTSTAAAEQAVRDTIQRSNDAQARAFASYDDTLMRTTATDSFYAQLRKTNADLRSGGVASIALVDLTFENVAVNGDSATATTLETWRSTYPDGSADENTDRNVYTLVRQGGTWLIDSDDQPSAASAPTTPTIPTDPSVPTRVADDTSTSTNWSGYAAGNGSYTSVSGSWIVPTVSSTSVGADATWVGIGGLTSNDLIQAGTQATVSGGAVTYEAWVEMLPSSSHTVPLSVTAGDAVTVTISERANGQWDIVIKDDTTGERYSTTVQYASSKTSAEWIEEAPSVGRGTIPLDSFGTLTFTSATAVRGGQTVDLASSGAHSITMITGAGQALAQPSQVGADGKSFTITRTSVTSGGTGIPGGRRRRG